MPGLNVISYTNNGTGKSGRRQRQTIHTKASFLRHYDNSERECMYGKINSNNRHNI